jgi:hypothetical protein
VNNPVVTNNNWNCMRELSTGLEKRAVWSTQAVSATPHRSFLPNEALWLLRLGSFLHCDPRPLLGNNVFQKWPAFHLLRNSVFQWSQSWRLPIPVAKLETDKTDRHGPFHKLFALQREKQLIMDSYYSQLLPWNFSCMIVEYYSLIAS